MKKIIDSLIKLDPENNLLHLLKKDFQSLINYIYNYRKIRIPLLGGYSTGKSSFLNNLIGKDILPVDINRCTNRGIIIRHNSNNCVQLFKPKFIHLEDPEYWYFEDEKLICEGYEEVKKKLIDLNVENPKFEEAFIVLSVPMKLFSELDFPEKSMKKIFEEKLELIDFPGLDVKENFYEKEIFTPLMRFSDGFIFVNECDLIEESGNLKILKSMMSQIIARKLSLPRSCFFLLHKLDKSLHLNVEKANEIYENLFLKAKNDRNGIDGLNINKFSSKLYGIYREFFNKYIKDFDSFIKYIIENLIKPEQKKNIQNYNEFLNIINNIIKKLKFQINNKFIKKKDGNEKEKSFESINVKLYKVYESLKLESNNSEEKTNSTEISKIIQEIYSNYLYIFKNHKFQNQRLLSNADGLFASLSKLFKTSYEDVEKTFYGFFSKFIENFNDLFVTIDLKIYGSELNKNLEFKKSTQFYNETNNIYKEHQNYICNQKKKIQKKNKELVDNFFKNYEDNESRFEDIGKKIEENIQNNISEFSNEVNNNIINKLNKIIEYLKIDGKKIKDNSIDYSKYEMNKDFSTINKFKIDNNDRFLFIFKGIGNVFINYYNNSKKKEKIQNNFYEFLKNTNNLIDNYIEAYTEEIKSLKNEIISKIKYDFEINSINYDNINKKREEYEEIKDYYLKIIKPLKIE